MENENLIELLEIYIELTEKQDDTIKNMSEMLKKQAVEIAHLRNLLKCESI